MNTTNTLLIIIVVLLVGFGVWYFTTHQNATVPSQDGIDVHIGGSDDGTPDKGSNY